MRVTIKKKKNMKRVQVNITSNLSNVPNLDELIQKEFATVGQWKEQGILEHLFVKEAGDGAVLVFMDIDEVKASELIPTLPLSTYFVNVEYLKVDKQF
jgi:muconolactone D-isomerase